MTTAPQNETAADILDRKIADARGAAVIWSALLVVAFVTFAFVMVIILAHFTVGDTAKWGSVLGVLAAATVLFAAAGAGFANTHYKYLELLSKK